MVSDAKTKARDRLLLSGLALISAMCAIALFAHQWASIAWLAPMAIGVALSTWGYFQLMRVRTVRMWPPIRAVILTSELGEVFIPGESGGYYEYFPIVRFSYSTSMGEQHSSRYSPAVDDNRDTDKAAVLKVLAAYTPGANVTAYIPSDYSELAVLHQTVSHKRRSHYLAMVVGGFIVISVSLLVPFLLES